MTFALPGNRAHKSPSGSDSFTRSLPVLLVGSNLRTRGKLTGVTIGRGSRGGELVDTPMPCTLERWRYNRSARTLAAQSGHLRIPCGTGLRRGFGDRGFTRAASPAALLDVGGRRCPFVIETHVLSRGAWGMKKSARSSLLGRITCLEAARGRDPLEGERMPVPKQRKQFALEPSHGQDGNAM